MESRVDGMRTPDYAEPPEETARGTSVLGSARRRWPLVLIVAVATFAGAYWYAERLPVSYTATAIVVLEPRPSAAAVSTGAVTLAGAKYVAYLESSRAAADVAKLVRQDPSEVARSVSAEVQTNTGNVEISVTWPGPARAAEIANRFARELVKATQDDALVVGDSVSHAVLPTRPSGPPRRAMEAASVAVGLGLGLALAVALERARPRVADRSELERIAGPVLAEIPRARVLKRHPRKAFDKPNVGTPARHLRTNVDARLPRQHAVVSVTSPTRGDGKSAVAALLAEAFARRGQQTLLLDADVHGSRLARRFGINRTASIASIARAVTPVRDAAQPGWTQNLFVLLPKHDKQDTDQIAQHFQALVSWTREAYQITVVDLPPLIGVDDARVAAPVTDGVVLVVSAGASPAVVQDAIDALEMVGAPYFGAVANRWRVRAKPYDYK